MAEETFVVAKYDYKAVNPDELDIKKNDRLTVLDESSQWWLVRDASGRSGLVPSNYVKPYKPSLLSSIMSLGRRKSGQIRQNQTLSTCQSDLNAGYAEVDAKVQIIPCESFSATAKYAYEAKQADEMNLSRGEIVTVFEKSSDGWWHGRKNAKESGWFPYNYVTICDAESAQVRNSLPLATAHSENGEKEALCVVVAIFRYSAENDEEVSFEENEKLELLEEYCGTAGWWKVRNNKGREGRVPQAYLQKVDKDFIDPSSTSESVSADSLSYYSPPEETVGNPQTVLNSSPAPDDPYAGRDWYHGRITRTECEQIMNQWADNGDFIVRPSETNVNYLFFIFKM